MVAAVQSKSQKMQIPNVLENLYKNLMKEKKSTKHKKSKRSKHEGDIDDKPKSKEERIEFKRDRQDSTENKSSDRYRQKE